MCRCRSPKKGLEKTVTTNVILISFHWPKGCWDFVRGKRYEGEGGENWIAEKDIRTSYSATLVEGTVYVSTDVRKKEGGRSAKLACMRIPPTGKVIDGGHPVTLL